MQIGKENLKVALKMSQDESLICVCINEIIREKREIGEGKEKSAFKEKDFNFRKV